MTKNSLQRRLDQAINNDNTILVTREDLGTVQGFPLEHFLYLGLRKSDLKKLESQGKAIRGYTKNVWLPGEKLPNGREVRPNLKYHGKGSKLKWILIKKEENENK